MLHFEVEHRSRWLLVPKKEGAAWGGWELCPFEVLPPCSVCSVLRALSGACAAGAGGEAGGREDQEESGCQEAGGSRGAAQAGGGGQEAASAAAGACWSPRAAPAAVSGNPAAVPTQTEGESAQLRGFVLRSPCRVVLLAVSPGCHPRFFCGSGQILTKHLNLWIGKHENVSVKPLSEVQSAVAVGPLGYAVGSAGAAGAVTHRLGRWGHQCFPAEQRKVPESGVREAAPAPRFWSLFLCSVG